jgi:hypothetical protein
MSDGASTNTGPAGAGEQGADWREQAHAAGAKATALEQRLTELDKQLADSKAALATLERKRAIERELVEQGTIDLEAAGLLAEAAVAGLADPNLPGAIAELKRRKPHLFRPAAPAGAMSSAPGAPAPPLEEAAATARATGDRRALLSYLRLRRTP